MDKSPESNLTLTIDEVIVNKYADHYFATHTRAKKVPIESPHHPSINKWMIMKRLVMNSVKQKYKDFIVWFVKLNGYEHMNIERCNIKFTYYFKANNRHDADNYVPKFILDGFVESGLIADDDSKHLVSLTLECRVDKKHPRTEINIEILNS